MRNLNSNFNSTSPNGQLNTLGELSDVIDDIFARLDAIDVEIEQSRIELLSRYSLNDLAQIAADNSGKDGDKFVASYVVRELERRCSNG